MPEMNKKPKTSVVSLLGIPFDAGSSYMRGPARGPARIRQALGSSASNRTAEDGFVVAEGSKWRDAGDIDCQNNDEDFAMIDSTIAERLSASERVLSLGGDHSITYPIMLAYARRFPGLTILHIDAHPDLYDELDGNRLSHACPFARIMENKLATRLVQVGIRTLNEHQARQAERFGVEVHPMNTWRPATDLALSGPLYLSIDIDALDPAFAPGVSHHEPGGLTVRELLGVIQNINVPVVGADIVEYNPDRDINNMTATVCAKLVKEVSSVLARSELA